MPPDRVVGALSLLVALVALTWGAGPSDEPPPQRVEVRAARAPSAEVPPPGETTTTAEATSTTTGPASSTTTSTAAPSTTSTTTGEANDAYARRVLLAQGDLPSGFVQVRPAASDGASAEGPFERCLGPDAATLTAAVRAKARSAEFGRSGVGTVSSSSAVFDHPRTAEKVMAVLATPAARGCFEGVINARLARNPNLPEDARGSLTPIDPGSFGDQSTAFRFEVQLPAEDLEEEPTEEEIPYLADFVFLRKGRALVLLEFGNLRRPFSPADLKAVATGLARRI